MTGPFVIPQHKHHSTTGARTAFEKCFDQPWQGTDDELREAGRLFRQRNPKGSCKDFVLIMIETGDQSTRLLLAS